MLDYRHQTFLVLCRIGSYTQAAKVLNLTQPAVTQHIKALEAHYGSPLFTYANRTLTLTEHGKLLYEFASRVSSDSDILTERLRQKDLASPHLRFGATLSIGQYIMPSLIKQILATMPATSVSMVVENTQHLLEKLVQGDIQFALIEGIFDKTAYHSELFAMEPFIGVCSKDSLLADRPVSFDELISHHLIVREPGSGTREILESLLHQHNFSINSFAKVTEIGNKEAIKQLVKDDLGITFLYRVVAQEELARGELRELSVKGMDVQHELNFVFLKGSQHSEEYLSWYRAFKEGYQGQKLR
ncbi:MAG: LysR family transcriptional regulator [Firmicutes bacterium]|nr:LysR family transcriptional regulator [Bacillota bacterium]